MKKIITVFLLFAILLSLSACGSTSDNTGSSASDKESNYKDASINGVSFLIPKDWEEDTAAEAEESTDQVICGVYKYTCEGSEYKCMVHYTKTGNKFDTSADIQTYLTSITANLGVSDYSMVVKNQLTIVSGVPAVDVEYSFITDKVNSYFYLYTFLNGGDTIMVTIACPLGSQDQYADVVDHVVNSFDLEETTLQVNPAASGTSGTSGSSGSSHSSGSAGSSSGSSHQCYVCNEPATQKVDSYWYCAKHAKMVKDNSTYSSTEYDMPNESDESFSDYVQRVAPDLYDELQEQYESLK